jgi:hypothetical protein
MSPFPLPHTSDRQSLHGYARKHLRRLAEQLVSILGRDEEAPPPIAVH